MLKVTRTKEPTIPQIKRMSSNLRTKYRKTVNVEISTISEKSGQRFNFWLSVEKEYSGFLYTWEELQDKYFELIDPSLI